MLEFISGNSSTYPCVHFAQDKETVLILAAQKGYTEIVRILLRNGAQVNLTDRVRRTSIDASFYQPDRDKESERSLILCINFHRSQRSLHVLSFLS